MNENKLRFAWLLALGIALSSIHYSASADVSPTDLLDGVAGRLHIGMTSLELGTVLGSNVKLQFSGDNRSIASIRDRSNLIALGVSAIGEMQVIGVDITFSHIGVRDVVDMLYIGLSCQSARQLTAEWKATGLLVSRRPDGWSSGEGNHKYIWGITEARRRCFVWLREQSNEVKSRAPTSG